jgi:hypothetical protein
VTEESDPDLPSDTSSDEDWRQRRPHWPLSQIETTQAALDGVSRTASPAFESAQRSVSLARQLGRELSEVNAPFPRTPDTATVVESMGSALASIRTRALAVQDGLAITPEVQEALQDATADLDHCLHDFINLLSDETRERDTELSSLLAVYDDRLRARALLAETQGARNVAVQAAGATGETALASHFGRYSKQERGSADRLRAASVVVLIATAALAAILLSLTDTSDSSIGEELAKLSLTLPLAALAGYLAREASHHRSSAQWAAEVEVQLKTVDAYTTPLPDTLRDELRAGLGRRVFGSPGSADPTDRSELARRDAPADATALLDKIAALVGSSNAGRDSGDG